MAIFILPFDHRTGFAREIMQVAYPFSPADRSRAHELKRIIYHAFLDVLADASSRDTLGILLDEETGGSILHDAHNKGILTALTLECSGEPMLRIQYGDQSAPRLRMLGTPLGKVLLRFSSLPTKNDPQLITLQKLHAQLTQSGQRLLVELLSTGTLEEREAFLLHTFGLLESMGVVPEFWKVEGLATPQAWQHVRAVTRPESSMLVLGRGEDRAHVNEMLTIAKQSGVVDGFAIGRTLFAEPLREFLAGKTKEHAAQAKIADHFRACISLWHSL